MAEVDLQRILRLLPHRYPFLMIDKVRELEPKKRIVAIKNVSNNEPQFQGHFPGRPIMPGVLILEAFAQAAVVMMLALLVLLQHTDLGRAIRAASQEPEGARLVGISIDRIYMAAFGIGTACAAVAGAVVTPFFHVSPSAGESFAIIAFVVVVLGGMGSAVGALVGGIVIGVAEALGAVLLPGSFKELLIYAVFLGVLLLRPSGLFGRRGT